LRQGFGDQVQVSYHDMAQQPPVTQFADVLKKAQDRYWPYPLVLIGEQIVMAGHVDVYRLAMMIEQELS
jgi:disulfide oxidoreductase YuzD